MKRSVGRIDYNLEVHCKWCGEKRLKSSCILVGKDGYRCPECHRKCRTRPVWKRNYKLHPYVPSNIHMKKEIMLIAKEKTWME